MLVVGYDEQLREAYTTIGTDDVANSQVLSALLGRSAGLADTAPLKKTIARFLTQQMLDEIAVASRKGHILLIGTTNLESQRPIIWDIGAIAESGHPRALELVREIILASASIPARHKHSGLQIGWRASCRRREQAAQAALATLNASGWGSSRRDPKRALTCTATSRKGGTLPFGVAADQSSRTSKTK
jgi:hypothetical protein